MNDLILRESTIPKLKYLSLFLISTMVYGCNGGSSSSSVGETHSSPASQASSQANPSSMEQASSSLSSSSPSSIEPPASSMSASSIPQASNVKITGTVTFDFTAYDITPGTYSHSVKLNFNAIAPKPARFVTIEARDAAGKTLAASRTNEQGQYSIDVPQNTELQIVAKSEIIRTKGTEKYVEIAAADFRKNSKAIYEVASEMFNGDSITTQHLHAEATNDGSHFLAGRLAPPFSIIDTLYDGVLYMAEYDPTLTFPKLILDWNDGRSGALFYGLNDDGERVIHLNGAATLADLNDANDASGDEPRHVLSDYAVDVIRHEFFHYVQDSVLPMRDDSGGGGLTRNFPDADLALVLSEASADAFALMVKNQPVFSTLISSNLTGFGEEYEKYSSASHAPGYFEKGTVAALIWDLFDGTDEENDNVELGSKFLDVFTSAEYNNAPGVTSVYTILHAVKAMDGIDSAAVDKLAQSHSIFGNGPLGEGETTDLGAPNILPVYNSLALNGEPINFCLESSDDVLTRYLTVSKRFLFDNAAKQDVTLSITQTSGQEDRDIQLGIKTAYRGSQVGRLLKGDDMNNLTTTFTDLEPGNSYMISTSSSPLGGENTPGVKFCFDISLATN